MLKNNILDNAENKISLIDNEVKEILEKYSDKSIEYFKCKSMYYKITRIEG